MAPTIPFHREGPGGKRSDLQVASGYAGLYWNSDNETYRRFAFEGGKLAAVNAAGRRLTLEPAGPDRFALGNLELLFSISDTTRRPQLSVSRGDNADVERYDAVDEFHPAPEQLRDFAGAYWSVDIETVFRLQVEDNLLFLARLKHPPEKLTPVLRDVFRASFGMIRFTRGSQGQIDGILVSSPGVLRLRFDRMR